MRDIILTLLVTTSIVKLMAEMPGKHTHGLFLFFFTTLCDFDSMVSVIW